MDERRKLSYEGGLMPPFLQLRRSLESDLDRKSKQRKSWVGIEMAQNEFYINTRRFLLYMKGADLGGARQYENQIRTATY